MEIGQEFTADNLQDNISQRMKGLRTDSIGKVDSTALGLDVQSKRMSEATQSTAKFQHFVMAGAAAGIMEHCLMYPVDCVKKCQVAFALKNVIVVGQTRMQCLRPNPNAIYSGIGNAIKTMIRTEGALSPLRGMNVVALGAGPAHAVYFSSYEVAKKFITNLGPGNHSRTLAAGGAGVVATLFHDAAMNPIDLIKQRLQMYNSPYRGVVHCFKTVIKEEGIRAFYRSYSTQLTMNIPFQCIHFMTYEAARANLNPSGGYHAMTHIIAGGTAGALAAAITTPLDVAKTLLNTQERCAVCEVTHSETRVFITGMFNAMSSIYKLQGIKGYFRGIRARVIYQIPSCAICWSVYEFFKHSLSLSPEEQVIWMENAV
eukprot:gene5693-6394_t